MIDFGKACFATQGKYYKLSEEEKDIYKNEHSHVAPDLRDGVISQSKASDVYAIGQLIYYVYKKAHLSKLLQSYVQHTMIMKGPRAVM